MASFFSKLASAATSAANAIQKSVQEAAEKVSLDNLQSTHGDVDGSKAMFAGLDITYLTPRVLAMGFPCSAATRIRSRNDAAAVGALLAARHGPGAVLVINASEEGYDAAPFGGCVLEVHFPGCPAPPLGLLLQLAQLAGAWLSADPSHAVAVHCTTGRGRTSVIAAVILAWLGPELGGMAPRAAMPALAALRGLSGSADTLLAASHSRCAQARPPARPLWASPAHLPAGMRATCLACLTRRCLRVPLPPRPPPPSSTPDPCYYVRSSSTAYRTSLFQRRMHTQRRRRRRRRV
jgi:hypothetical protein